jgi:phage terminase large subunit GpA-like protein
MPNTATDIQPGLIRSRRLPLRPWMPAAWRRSLAGRDINLRVSEPVRMRCRKPKRILPSEHSERYRRMPSADAHPGAWRREFARPSVKVMDTWAQPWVREVWFCGVDQMSKTNTMLSCLGWSIEHAPGNIFYQMPDEASSDKIMDGKINAMLKGSPRLARYLSPRADDTSLSKTSLINGVTVLPAWSGSLSSTATFSALYTFTDELDKCKMVGKEASPVDRIKKRTRNKRFGKHFFASTPAGQWIYEGTMACAQVWVLAGRCPECGELIVMDEDHVVIPDGTTLDDIQADPSIIEYACSACGSLWDEAARAVAHERGDWVCIKGGNLAKPSSVGFLGPAFPLPELPLVDIAKVILKARGGDLSAKRDLAHGIKAVDYEDTQSDRKEDAILRLCDDRPAGVVHPETDILTIHIDTQDKGFWYEIRGWQYGSLTSWLVKAGYVPSVRADDFSALDKLLFEDRYFDAVRREYRISYGIIDAMGHRTAEVYAWCKRTGIFPSKGAQGRKAQPVTVSKQDFFPGTNKPIPGGLLLYNLDTHFHKDLLANKLLADPTDAGAWVLHSGYGSIHHLLMKKNPGIRLGNGLEEYARQFCAEYRDEKGLWQCPNGKANHLFDCAQMGLALALYLGFQDMVSEKKTEKMNFEPPPVPAESAPAAGRPSWFHNRGRK